MHATTRGTARSIHRVIAFGMLRAFFTSAVEAVAGPVRDRTMHHETNAEAESHRTAQGSGHDHLRSVPKTAPLPPSPDAHRDQPDRVHPGGDHCTHVHGVSLVPHLTCSFYSTVVALPDTPADHREDPAYTRFPHPPRA